jgi:uncharacterized damage-inducible protein DinB
MSTNPQAAGFVAQLQFSKEFFERSSGPLEESDSGFRPQPEMMTVAQQVAHTAQTLDWFVNGVTTPEGFDLNFAEHAKALEAVTSLAAARQMLDAAYAKAIGFAGSRSAEELAAPMPPGPILGGAPLGAIIWAMVEHTAHHRGALTVYCRMLGKVPPMPYGG